MIGHIPPNTRIFIGLVIITLLTTYLALSLTSAYEDKLGSKTIKEHIQKQEKKIAQPAKIDSSTWETYQEATYPLSFKHPATWLVTSNTSAKNLDEVTINVPNSDGEIHIYINKTGLLGFDGLSKKPYTVDGVQGSISGNLLIGLKAGEYYYTFDGTETPHLEKEFTAFVESVRFDQAQD